MITQGLSRIEKTIVRILIGCAILFSMAAALHIGAEIVRDNRKAQAIQERTK